MAIKLAMVDFDGTLADSMPFWLQRPLLTLAAAGLPEPEGFQTRIRTYPMREIAVYLTELYPSLAEKEPLRALWRRQMAREYNTRVPLKPGAAALLALLRESGARVYIVSATDHALLDPALARLGLTALLDGVLTEAELGSKHTDAPYLSCMAMAGTTPAETLLVEDSYTNIRQAATLGVETAAVRDDSMALWEAQLRQTASVYLDSMTDLTLLRAFLQKKLDNT